MRLSIDHRTRYTFSAPQSRLVQMLRLTPAHTHDQTVASWHLHVDCDASMRTGRDGFGNAVTMLYVEGPIDGITVEVTGEVLTSHSSGVVHGSHEPLPPALFRRVTPVTAADPAIAAFARDLSAGDPLGDLHRLTDALHARFASDRGRPAPGTTAAQAFAAERLTPRDMAHVFIAAARSLGAPARYVSGYCAAIEGDHRPSPHGWAEAHVDGIGWIGFDPCLGRSPEEEYVRVAIGLDAFGAAPVAGSRLGDGTEVLDVDVSVHRES